MLRVSPRLEPQLEWKYQ